MIRLLSILSIFIFNLSVYSQTTVNEEEFDVNFLATKTGGQWIFKGKHNSFSIDVSAKKIETTESPNYIIADNVILQSSVIPLPKTNLDLLKLTTDQQKQALDGYVEYELDYFRDDLKIQFINLKKEWITVNTKLWLVWTFDIIKVNSSEPVEKKVKSQVYASTICLNQVLDLNTPVMSTNGLNESKKIINSLMATLKL